MCKHKWNILTTGYTSTRCILCGKYLDSNGVATVDKPSVVKTRKAKKKSR